MIGAQQQILDASVEELTLVRPNDAKPELLSDSYSMMGIVLVVVAGLHMVLVMQAISRTQSIPKAESPAIISGVLITRPQQPDPTSREVPEQPRLQPTSIITSTEPKPVDTVIPEIFPPKPKDEPVEEVTPIAKVNDAPVNITDYPAEQVKTDSVTEEESTLLPTVIPPRSDARHLSNPAPIYPRTALRLGQEGRVILTLLVRVDGSVDDVQVTTSSGYQRLDKAALKAVRRWRYQPASQDGQPIDFWYQQPIVFSLHKQGK